MSMTQWGAVLTNRSTGEILHVRPCEGSGQREATER
jgi:hypothetical protein